MLQKKGIRYLRYSRDKQSFHSIERQDQITGQWMTFNNVFTIDTFQDEGYTARTFDRPDIKQLFDFIKRNHKGIDFLVVSELTRFSREAGDAINMVKKIQREYNIRIVSAGRGTIYDCMDHNSFFMMGLEFLLGNSENIKRQNDINGGIYTAKAVKGKWIQGGFKAPYGYKLEGSGEHRRLVICKQEAYVVRIIYESCLAGVPDYKILEQVKELGFNRTGSSVIENILNNPLYYGYQYVKPWKELPGGLFPLQNHTPIIDSDTWSKVQQRIKRLTDKPRVSISDVFPLRGVLKCHCSKMLTGAPSRNRWGNYYNYYKCTVSGHNNLRAEVIHDQLIEALKWMSLPEQMIKDIKAESEQVLTSKLKDNKQRLQQKQREYDQAISQLESIETKWINNQLSFESYDRWYSQLTPKIHSLKSEIYKSEEDEKDVYELLHKELDRLSDLGYVYQIATTTQKQEFIRKGFDNGLYYQNGVYRTPYLMPAFQHNLLILKEKKLLELDENKMAGLKIPPSGGERIRTAVQT
jgi:site-specific DNA recombinase